MCNNDLFKPVNVYTDEMYVKGIYPACINDKDGFVKKDDPEKSEKRSVLVPLEFGSVYVIKFPNKTDRLRAAAIDGDPRELPVGASVSYDIDRSKAFFEGEPDKWDDFMYTPNGRTEFLVIYTSDKENIAIEVNKYPCLLGHDTDDEWFYGGKQKDIHGNADSWGKWDWTSDEFIEHVYEPLRKKYPDYITRQFIGKDHTNTYNTWAYFFEPADYEQVMFITSGIHAAEMDAYLGLGRFMELLCEEDGSNAGLHYLHTKVKLIVIPVVNVYSASTTHVRENASGQDLNRDFELHTQAESVNVIWLLNQYKDQVSALIDYHCCRSQKYELYYQFSIQAPNAQLCLKCTNHVQEDLKRRGLAKETPYMGLIPGGYNKHDKYLQGFAWNHFGIPTLVCEHQHEHWDEGLHSALGLELCVDYFGNFMIQTALAKLKLIK